MISYPILVEPADATHAFCVIVPDLPGCFSAGDTLDEAKQNAKEAIELWIAIAYENGGDVPPPTSLDDNGLDGYLSMMVEVDSG
jgi:predicted RNase H-like HicB family nuclease